MNKQDAQKILELVSTFQTKAENVRRYEGNPYVRGDNIPEHVSRMARLLIYIGQDLKKEFTDFPSLIEDALHCVLVHDDDEVIVGFDIPTAIKNHNENNEGEIESFANAVSSLPKDTQGLLVDSFSSFRNKSSLPAKIAKVLDNITGNQLVIEQKVGLINPDLAKFCIEYAEKVRGVSGITDALVDAQIEQVVRFRDNLKGDEAEIEEMRKLLKLPESIKIKQLLDIDVSTHTLDRTKVYLPVQLL